MNNAQKKIFINDLAGKAGIDQTWLSNSYEYKYIHNLYIEGIESVELFLEKYFPKISALQMCKLKRKCFVAQHYIEYDYSFNNDNNKIYYYYYYCDEASLYDMLKEFKAPIIKSAILT